MVTSKKSRILWLIISTITICLFSFPAYAKYSGGTGEPNDPYQIATAEDLIALGETPEDYDKHFILTADIDLDPNLPGGKIFDKAVIAHDVNDANWEFDGTAFSGVFDGNDRTISHLTIKGKCYLGLFGLSGCWWWQTPGGAVKRLGLVDVNITGSGDLVGALVGGNFDGSVTECHSTGAVTGTEDVGGLVGSNSGTVSSCYSTSTVSGIECVGGLVGSNAGEVTRCYSTSVVSATGYSVGGLVGANAGYVTQCCSAGVVYGGKECVGGLVGFNFNAGSSQGGTIIQCGSTCPVSGNSLVGGLVGRNDADYIDDPRSSGQAHWVSSGCMIFQSYSTGAVSGDVSGDHGVGGLAGWSMPGDVIASFWDTQTSGQATSAGGTGKSTAEMQTTSTFLDAGWDFNDVWVIWDGYDYPRLEWEPGAGLVFVDVPAGTFEMGDHDGVGWEDERPVHTVTLDGFQMSQYETTNAQYAAYLNAALSARLIQVVDGGVYASSDANLVERYCWTYGSGWWDWWGSWSQIEYSQGRFTVRSRDGMTMSDHPVGDVYWYGAKAFCDYYGYRLPTEAEWEYAARGGYHDPYYQYPWGSSTIDCTKANYWGDSGPCNPLNLTSDPYTSPVGYYGPQGAYGLCDMAGNVWEWCQDWYDEDYYSVSPASNPTGPDQGWYRVLRGGSWNCCDVYCCHVVNRGWNVPDYRHGGIFGLRVCR